MKKAILISIRPEWVEKILNGEKIFEIRKTSPYSFELPLDVYIYCTQGRTRGTLIKHAFDGKYRVGNCVGSNDNEPLNGKVVAKFTLQHLFFVFVDTYSWIDNWFAIKACMSKEDIKKYAGNKFRSGLNAWRIDNLKMLDQPKELSDFGLKRAPQSWQFVEVDE